jgi:DNA repair protein SbcC/Rad50
MKKITLKSMHLENFKGAKRLDIDFFDVTDISGDNGTGKTTVFDAFNWLLWGRNSENETNFGVKTWNEDNEPIHKLRHAVKAELIVGGEIVILERSMREKWQKKRGFDQEHFTGHETEFFINGVAKQAGEFKSFVNTVIPESISRMVTDPLYFNKFMKWEDRRVVLTEIAGEVSDVDILRMNPELDEIEAILESTTPGDKIANAKAVISSKIKTLKSDLSDIPARIDEVQRSMPEQMDWDVLEAKKAEIAQSIDSVNKKISDEQARANDEFEAIRHLTNEKNELLLKVDQMRSDLFREANAKRNELVTKKEAYEKRVLDIESEMKMREASITGNKVRIKELTTTNENLKASYNELNSKPISVSDVVDKCPACNQQLPLEEIEQTKQRAVEKANKMKVESLNKIAEQAKVNNAEIQRLQQENSTLQVQQEDAFDKVKEIRSNIELIGEIPEARQPKDNDQIKEVLDRIEILRSAIAEPAKNDSQELKSQLSELQLEQKEVEDNLTKKHQIEIAENRILELTEKQKATGSEIAKLERTEHQINTFQKIKIQAVEDRVNDLFENVKFKMFEPLVNGGEQPTCICTLNGVNFQDLNTASKINAGLDVIRTLQKHFEILAPVFIDNRESVTSIIPMDCQIINLVKTTGQNKLTIKNGNNE